MYHQLHPCDTLQGIHIYNFLLNWCKSGCRMQNSGIHSYLQEKAVLSPHSQARRYKCWEGVTPAYLPSQVLSSTSSKPAGQSHSKSIGRSRQIWEQPPLFTKHSFIPIEKRWMGRGLSLYPYKVQLMFSMEWNLLSTISQFDLLITTSELSQLERMSSIIRLHYRPSQSFKWSSCNTATTA